MLKFTVSTCPIRCTRSMKLPDLKDAVEYSWVLIHSGDETLVQKELAGENQGSRAIERGEKDDKVGLPEH